MTAVVVSTDVPLERHSGRNTYFARTAKQELDIRLTANGVLLALLEHLSALVWSLEELLRHRRGQFHCPPHITRRHFIPRRTNKALLLDETRRELLLRPPRECFVLGPFETSNLSVSCGCRRFLIQTLQWVFVESVILESFRFERFLIENTKWGFVANIEIHP